MDTRPLILFDFDGTLTRKDTLLLFLLHTHGRLGVALRAILLMPVLALRFAGRISAKRSKEIVMATFYRGWPRTKLEAAGRELASRLIADPAQWHPAVLERLRRAVADGERPVIISASMSEWVAPAAGALGAEVVCTRLLYGPDGRFTGRFDGPNMNGQRKAEAVRLLGTKPTEAYGNSKGDEPMLRMAARGFMVGKGGDVVAF